MKTRYYVCGIGYNKHECIIDYVQDFGNFDTYEEAYEIFVKLQCKNVESFFVDTPAVSKLFIQLEECEETNDEITCIDVKNEWWIINPDYKEVK